MSTEGSITIIGLDKISEDPVKGVKGGTNGSTIAGGVTVVSHAGPSSGGSAQGPGLGLSGSVATTNTTTIPPMSLQNPTTLGASDHNSNIHTTGGGVNTGEAVAALSTHSSSPGSSTSSSRARSKSTSLTGKE